MLLLKFHTCSDDDLFDHYLLMLEALGNQKGLLGLIFNKSQNKFQDPAKLRRLIASKACWKRTPRTPSPAPVSTSPRGR